MQIQKSINMAEFEAQSEQWYLTKRMKRHGHFESEEFKTMNQISHPKIVVKLNKTLNNN